MKTTACLICRNEDATTLVRFDHDPYHRHLAHLKDVPVTYAICGHCGFVFTNPCLDDQELAVLYGEKLRPAAPTQEYLKANRAVYLRRYRWIAEQLGLPKPGVAAPSMLEVGCAAGVALSVFREQGWAVRGIEPAETFAAFARDHFTLDVTTGFYGPGSFDGEAFDLVVMSQVLEHVPDPRALLAQVRRNLPAGAHLFLAVPTLMRPMLPVHPMTLQAIHLWMFSLNTLRRLLAGQGFMVTAHTCDGKGLLVLAKRLAEPSIEAPARGDDPERVRRYFREFTLPDSRFGKNLAALRAGDRTGLRPGVLDADLTNLSIVTDPAGYLNLREDAQGRAPRWFYTGDPRSGPDRWQGRMDMSEDGVAICMGFGMGYLPQAILSRLGPGQSLIVCEADPRIFKTAMFHQDLTGLLDDERVYLLLGDDTGRLDQLLGRIGKKISLVNKIHIVRCHASRRWNRAVYEKLEARVQDRLKVMEINRNTIGGLGRRMMANVLENAHLTMEMPGVTHFAGRFKGLPAIIVSAGPSLEKNFELLREAKGRAVIIACDTVLRLLVPNGIMPDITITADPHERTYRKFRDLPVDDRSLLICHPSNYPDLFRTFAGHRFTTATHSPLYKTLARFWEDKGRIDQGAQSSAHQAFNLATLIGADPIVFVGQDLCFYDRKKHAGNLSKDSPLAAADKPSLHEPAADILGRPVETSTLFLSFKVILEDQIRKTRARVINATEGGLGLAGTEVLTLRDALRECCHESSRDLVDELDRLHASGASPADVKGLRAEVQRLHAQARDTFRAVRSMERLVERAWNLLSRTRPDERRIKTLSDRIERESARMAGREELLNLLVEGAFMLELYMSKESVRAIDGIADPVERFRKQIERARVYYGAMKDVLPVLVNGLAALRANLDAHARAERMPEGTTAQRLGKALAFKAIKNYPRARALYRQVLTDEPDNLQALFHTGEILYECHRAEEALACFTRVTTLSPRHRGAAAWIPRCREKAALWEDKTAEAQAVRRADAERDRMAEAAGLYAAVGDCRRATQALREWMRREPGDVEPHLRLAALCRTQEDVAGELRSYEEGLAAHPDHPALLQALGFFSIRLGRPDQAGAFFRAAGRSDPALCEAGADALMQAGAFLEAGDLYETAVRHAPGRFDLIEKSAQAFRRAGRMLAAAGGAR